MASKQKYILKKERLGQLLKITFQGEEMDPSLINALRRILIGENITVSLMGNSVIHLNTTVINNEQLINQIQMIPISRKPVDLKDENLVFHLCAEGDPKAPLTNNNDLDLIVGAFDFQVYDRDGNRNKFQIQDLVPYNFPLVKLRKGQELHLSIEPSEGIGRQHATWKSCIASYKYENDISLGRKKPNGFNPITGEAIETIEDKRNYPRNRMGNPEHISLTLKENGHLSSDECFLLAVNTLENKIRNFGLLVNNPMAQQSENTTSVEIIPSTDIPNEIQIKITDPSDLVTDPLATHTLGNLLSEHLNHRMALLLGYNYDEKFDKIRETMGSYLNPHPLDPIIYLRIKTPDKLYPTSDLQPALQLLEETIDNLLDYLKKIKEEFKNLK